MKRKIVSFFTGVTLSLSLIYACFPSTAFADNSIVIDYSNFPDEGMCYFVSLFDDNSDGILSPEESSNIKCFCVSDASDKSRIKIEYKPYSPRNPDNWIEVDKISNFKGIELLTNVSAFSINTASSDMVTNNISFTNMTKLESVVISGPVTSNISILGCRNFIMLR